LPRKFGRGTVGLALAVGCLLWGAGADAQTPEIFTLQERFSERLSAGQCKEAFEAAKKLEKAAAAASGTKSIVGRSHSGVFLKSPYPASSGA